MLVNTMESSPHTRSARHKGTQRLMASLLEAPYVVATATGATNPRGRKALDDLLAELDEDFIMANTEAITTLAQRYCAELQARRGWSHPWLRLNEILAQVTSRDEDQARAAAMSFVGEWRRLLREDNQTE